MPYLRQPSRPHPQVRAQHGRCGALPSLAYRGNARGGRSAAEQRDAGKARQHLKAWEHVKMYLKTLRKNLKFSPGESSLTSAPGQGLKIFSCDSFRISRIWPNNFHQDSHEHFFGTSKSGMLPHADFGVFLKGFERFADFGLFYQGF